jgi:hypothetical protein
MYIDLHYSSVNLDSTEQLEQLREAMVYDGMRFSILPLSSNDYTGVDLKKNLFNLTATLKECGYTVVQKKNDIYGLETDYTPKLGFHFEISSSLLEKIDEDTIAALISCGVVSVGFEQNASEQNCMNLLKQSWFKNKFIVVLNNTKQEIFSEKLALLPNNCYINLDVMNPNDGYSNSSEGLKSLFEVGGKACLTFHDLYGVGLPGIVAYAKKIKEMVDMYGSDNFCISTNGNDITKNRDKISPFSVLRTELLRLGMSDKNLDNIFFKTSYEFLKQSLS